MELFDTLKKRLFSPSYLIYWCVMGLDCVTFVLSGLLSLYLTLGGEQFISSFWSYFYIWVISLPLFFLCMLLFKSYSGIAQKPLLHTTLSVTLAMLLGGVILLGFCELVPQVIFPFRPALRTTALAIVISAVLQSLYRVIGRLLFKLNTNGGSKIWAPFRKTNKNGQFVDTEAHKRINLCLAHMSEEELEKKYVREAFDTNWVVPLGPNVNAFEQDLVNFVNDSSSDSQPSSQNKQVAALSAGTAALHLALIACDVCPGDEVCVQSFTFCASSNPIIYCGAVPVFIDSEPDTWNMDPKLLEKAIKDRIEKTGRKPKAIIPVALYGMPYDCERIMAIANKYDIPVIEDAAEGMGSRYNGKVLGSFGKYGVLSFNGNKMITTSGGGALICEDKESKDNILWYATQARESYPYYQHETIGYNYRMSNVCAGIGRGQMTVLNDHIDHHKHVQALYEELLRDVKGITLHKAPALKGSNGEPLYDSNYWLCAITLDPSLRIFGQEKAYKKVVQGAVGGAAGVIHTVDSPTTDCQPNANVEALRVFLDIAQIEARPVWKPMHKQPVFQGAPAYINGVSESIFKVGMCLPAGPYVTDNDVRYIVSTIKSAIIS